MASASLRQVRTEESTRRAMAGLRRRSLVIHFWRGALPTLIAVGLLGLIGWAGVNTLASLTPSQKAAGDIRMLNPEFHGRNKRGQPYLVTAQSAERDPAHPDRSTMVEPRLTMETADRGEMRVAAHGGRYDEQTKVMSLWGGVVLEDAHGGRFESPTATIDTERHTATGHDGVKASSGLGLATATSYAIDDKAGHVVLTGSVKTRLYPKTDRR